MPPVSPADFINKHFNALPISGDLLRRMRGRARRPLRFRRSSCYDRKPGPKRLRQLMLDMGGVDDQIVRRRLRSWRRARVVPVPEITADECRARAFA